MYCKVPFDQPITMNIAAPVRIARPSAGGPPPLGWRIAWWTPPALAVLLAVATESAALRGGAFLFGLPFPGAESAPAAATAWLSLLMMTGAAAVLSGYGCLLLAMRADRFGTSAQRERAGLVGGATVLILWAWGGIAAHRFGASEAVLGWLIGAHLPTLALGYGLLGSGVARMPNRRAGMAVLAGFPVLSLLAQLLYLPGHETREAALGFTLHSGLIVVCVAVRLAIWTAYDDGPSPGTV